MGPGCGEVAGGGMSVRMWCVRVFNTGDDGGEKLLKATVPQQVWTNYSILRDGCSEGKTETCIDVSCSKYSLVEVHGLLLTGVLRVRVFKFLKTHSSVTCTAIKKISRAIDRM